MKSLVFSSLVAAFTTTILLLVSSSFSFCSAATYNAVGVTLHLQNLHESEIVFTSIINSHVEIGPNVYTERFNFGIFSNSVLYIHDTRVFGSTFFSALSTDSNVTIVDCTFKHGGIRLATVNETKTFTFSNNNVEILANVTTANAALEFTSYTNISDFTFSGNTVSITSTASGIRGALVFSFPTVYSVDGSYTISNNDVTILAKNPRGVATQGAAINVADSFTISNNTFSLTSNADADTGVAICAFIPNFVRAETGGFFFTDNKCTVRCNRQTDGVDIGSSSLTTTSPTLETLNISGNTFDLVDSGSTGTARAIRVGFLLPTGPPYLRTVSTFRGNTITVTANRGVVAFGFSKGLNNYAVIDINNNNVQHTASSASSTSTDYSAIVRIAQHNAGFGASQMTMTFYKNTFAIKGAYGPGFIAVSDGTSGDSKKAISGSWLFRDNTLSSASTSAVLFSPTMDISHGSGNLTMSCTTYNGAALQSAQVASSITGTVPAGYYNDVGCTECSYSLFCNQNTTIGVHYDSSVSECVCRCRNYRYQYDPLPRGYQCRYRAGEPYTNSISKTRSMTLIVPTTSSTTTTTEATTTTTTTTTPTPNATTDGRIFDDSSELTTAAIVGISLGSAALLALLIFLLFLCCCPALCCLCCCGKKKDEPEAVDPDDEETEDIEYDGNTINAYDGEIIPKLALDLPIVDSYIDERADQQETIDAYPDTFAEDNMNTGELPISIPANRYMILEEPQEGQGSSPSPRSSVAASSVAGTPQTSNSNNRNNNHHNNNNRNVTRNNNNHNNTSSLAGTDEMKTSPRRMMTATAPSSAAVNMNTHTSISSTGRHRGGGNNNNNHDDDEIEMTPNKRMSPRN